VTDKEKKGDNLDIMRILQMLPHRYPFLMIDRLVNVVSGERATGIKNVTANEPHFQGHFPHEPVMPGVLIIESMAQTAAGLVVHSLGSAVEGKLVFFMSIENARFRKPVTPGDQLYLIVEKLKTRGNVWKFNAIAEVEGETMAEATFTAMILDR